MSIKSHPVVSTINSDPSTLEQGQGVTGLTSVTASLSGFSTSQLAQVIHVLLTIVVLVMVSVLPTPYPCAACTACSYGLASTGPVVLSSAGSTSVLSSSSPFQMNLTSYGIEPNPGPHHNGVKHKVEEIVKVKSRLKTHIPKAPPLTRQIVLSNAPPISRSAPKNKSRKSTYLSGEMWNPRAEMIGYFQTLCDPERFPPVRLGGETMIQTGLTTLHQVFPFTAVASNQSVVVFPRVWNPVLSSTTQASPYTYTTSSGFNTSAVTTLQSLAASARVVSAKVKIYSTSSATSDNGALIAGLSPSDPGFGPTGGAISTMNLPNFANSSVTPNLNQTSVSGYPITSVNGANSDSVTNATQGFNEFSSEDWTDTVPLKNGVSVFWLPQDPASMVFTSDRLRQTLMAQTNTTGTPAGAAVNASPIQDPFFCFGLTGLTTSGTASTWNVEVFLNLEYTVTSGATNVIETRPGSMNSVEQFSVAKRVGGTLQNYVEPDPEACLTDKLKGLGSSILKGGVNRISEFIFGSSDVGKAVTNLFS